MATYSFLDFDFSFSGPGGDFQLGSGAGAAEEGITFSFTEEKNTMTVGADGNVMHSLHAGKSGTATLRLLKTSPVNARLETVYNFQTSTSSRHGRNTLTGRDRARGDVITCRQCAFAKFPDLTYAKDAGSNEWAFHVGMMDPLLGDGD